MLTPEETVSCDAPGLEVEVGKRTSRIKEIQVHDPRVEKPFHLISAPERSPAMLSILPAGFSIGDWKIDTSTTCCVATSYDNKEGIEITKRIDTISMIGLKLSRSHYLNSYLVGMN